MRKRIGWVTVLVWAMSINAVAMTEATTDGSSKPEPRFGEPQTVPNGMCVGSPEPSELSMTASVEPATQDHASAVDAPITSPGTTTTDPVSFPAGACSSVPYAGVDGIAASADGSDVPANESADHAEKPSKTRGETTPHAAEVSGKDPEASKVSARPPVKAAARRRGTTPSATNVAWWPSPRQGKLNILFVGGASFGSAIAVLTDGSFNSAELANRSITVRNATTHRTVSPRWVVATNKTMLLLAVAPGQYQVSIGAELVDAGGRDLSQSASGIVAVN